MTMDREGLDAAVRKYHAIDPVQGVPSDSLAAVVDAANNAADDKTELIWIAILLIEPLVDTHWATIEDEFGDALQRNRALREASRSADTHVPDEVEARLRTIAGSEF